MRTTVRRVPQSHPARVAGLAAELGGGARGYVADLASLGRVRDLAARVRGEVPRLDVLVNNAGIGFGAPGEGRQVSADGHELRFAVNYLAPVLLTRLLVPLLTASAPSRVVNVGSLGQVPFDPADAGFELRQATGRWAAVSAPFQRLGLACGMAVGPPGRPAGGRRAGEGDMRRSSKRVSMPAGQDPQ